ncbi:extracellular solute-binding protein [Saccharibacillus alkalitolerans]|uniref:Extracellular solute-binding protein n=1 Tax=Saccharibacillus alkalitolerans TaxID=2705290 RepID=A0ABX0F9E0_9BACL|nr:extracellular solute-binding protein [Saccharibacillus alkalitolerans]NGZ76545.1 extracellular solute-binding protein [Saccharibacillus alkalitolerans]
MVFENKEAFQKQYGDFFSKKYPDTEFEVIAPGYGAPNYDKLIAKHSPDLIMLDPYNYQQMAKADKLTDLEPLMERDNYDTSKLYPGLTDELKKQGGGKLYGLSKSVQANAVLYNADLFKKYKVELPKDGMTWEEILKLARKFPTSGDKDSRIWGLSSFGSSNLAMQIARTEGLAPIDPATLKVTANTPEWKKAYNISIEATKAGVLDEGISLSAKSYLQSNPFVMGRSAMVISSVTQLKNLQAAKSGVKNYKPFTLGIAAGPADSGDRKSTGDFYTGDIFAIPAKASNVDGAWQFIEYFTGDEYAKQYYGTKSSNNIALLSRMVDEYAGYKVNAFYKLKPNLDQHLQAQALSIRSANLEWKFWTVLQKELMLAVNKKKTADQAAAAIQTQTQAAADKVAKASKN